MRTKTLLVAGAISALALTASLAQSVYSVNVVGYVNVPVVYGYNLIANPLDASPDNVISSVIPTAADSSVILKWDATSQGFMALQTYYEGYGWADPDFNLSTTTIEPGEGFFFGAPAAATITFVGDVRQGDLSKSLVLGYNLVSQLTPQSGSIMDFNFPVADSDVLLEWDASTQSYKGLITYYDGYGWADGDFNLVTPNVNVGQGVFIGKAGPATWTYQFNVQ